MALQSLLVPLAAIFVCICFIHCHGKTSFDDLFNFEEKSHDDVVVMTGERIAVPDANMTLWMCKAQCAANMTCYAAIFSEVDYYGCHPTNCTHFYPRKSHGECHLLTNTDTQIDFQTELTGQRRHYYMDYPPTCRPKDRTNSDQTTDTRVVETVKRDEDNPGCYIFTYTCIPEYIALGGGNTTTCCEGREHPWQPLTLQCQKKEI